MNKSYSDCTIGIPSYNLLNCRVGISFSKRVKRIFFLSLVFLLNFSLSSSSLSISAKTVFFFKTFLKTFSLKFSVKIFQKTD